MKFLDLEIENFGSIGKLDIHLADQGLVLITGRNEDTSKADSNGAGKSLILEAFCWCLWGKTIRGLSGDDVVNTAVGKDCCVTVYFEDNKCLYQVIRSRGCTADRPNDLRIQSTTPTTSRIDHTGPSVAATQEYLIDLIGLNFDLFCAMMPGAGMRAAEMTDRDVKALLERLLQTEVLGKAHEGVKAQLKVVESDLGVKNTKRDMLSRAITDCDRHLGELKTSKDAYALRKKEEIHSIQRQIGQLLTKMGEQTKIIERAEKVSSKYEEAKEKLRNITEEIKVIGNGFGTLRNTHDEELSVLNLTKGAIQQKLSALETSLDSLPVQGACPTCHQEVPDVHVAEVREKLQAQLQSVFSEEVILTKSIEESHRKYTEFVTQLQSELKEARSKETLINTDITRFKGWQAERATAMAVQLQLVDQKNALWERQDALVAEENPFQGLITQTCEDAFSKAAEAARLYKEIKVLEHKHAVLSYWLTGFSPQGVRSFMLEHVTPLLNHSAAQYADLLTDGEMSVTFHTQQRQKSGKIVEKFNIQVEHVHGGGSYTASSAGERSRANLVVAFALGDLAALRANKTISFRFLDEPFENVDESGTDAIVALLNDQKERFETVFVITHQDHFKQLFPNRLTVVKKNGITSLEDAHV